MEKLKDLTPFLTFISELLPELRVLKGIAREQKHSYTKYICNLCVRAIDGAFLGEFDYDLDLGKNLESMIKDQNKKSPEESQNVSGIQTLLSKWADELENELERKNWNKWELCSFYLIYGIFNLYESGPLRPFQINTLFTMAQNSANEDDV